MFKRQHSTQKRQPMADHNLVYIETEYSYIYITTQPAP